MPVLIDGNNLLFAARDADPDKPVGRARLCELIGRWSRRTGQRAAIIFDGPTPPEELAAQIADRDVEVGYSEAEKADTLIVARIQGDSAPRRLIVVSTDREIARVAHRRRATPMRSDEFWDLVVADLSRPPQVPLEPIEKRRGLSKGQAEQWMRELGIANNKPIDDSLY